MAQAIRTEKLDLRLTAGDKRTLSDAARASRRSVSDFVLHSALIRAHETLPDRQMFGLTSEQWEEFQARLEMPTRSLPRLARLMSEPGRFDDKPE